MGSYFSKDALATTYPSSDEAYRAISAQHPPLLAEQFQAVIKPLIEALQLSGEKRAVAFFMFGLPSKETEAKEAKETRNRVVTRRTNFYKSVTEERAPFSYHASTRTAILTRNEVDEESKAALLDLVNWMDKKRSNKNIEHAGNMVVCREYGTERVLLEVRFYAMCSVPL